MGIPGTITSSVGKRVRFRFTVNTRLIGPPWEREFTRIIELNGKSNLDLNY